MEEPTSLTQKENECEVMETEVDLGDLFGEDSDSSDSQQEDTRVAESLSQQALGDSKGKGKQASILPQQPKASQRSLKNVEFFGKDSTSGSNSGTDDGDSPSFSGLQQGKDPRVTALDGSKRTGKQAFCLPQVETAPSPQDDTRTKSSYQPHVTKVKQVLFPSQEDTHTASSYQQALGDSKGNQVLFLPQESSPQQKRRSNDLQKGKRRLSVGHEGEGDKSNPGGPERARKKVYNQGRDKGKGKGKEVCIDPNPTLHAAAPMLHPNRSTASSIKDQMQVPPRNQTEPVNMAQQRKNLQEQRHLQNLRRHYELQEQIVIQQAIHTQNQDPNAIFGTPQDHEHEVRREAQQYVLKTGLHNQFKQDSEKAGLEPVKYVHSRMVFHVEDLRRILPMLKKDLGCGGNHMWTMRAAIISGCCHVNLAIMYLYMNHPHYRRLEAAMNQAREFSYIFIIHEEMDKVRNYFIEQVAKFPVVASGQNHHDPAFLSDPGITAAATSSSPADPFSAPNTPTIATPILLEMLDILKYSLEPWIEQKLVDYLEHFLEVGQPECEKSKEFAVGIADVRKKTLKFAKLMQVYEAWVTKDNFDLLKTGHGLMCELGGITGTLLGLPEKKKQKPQKDSEKKT